MAGLPGGTAIPAIGKATGDIEMNIFSLSVPACSPADLRLYTLVPVTPRSMHGLLFALKFSHPFSYQQITVQEHKIPRVRHEA